MNNKKIVTAYLGLIFMASIIGLSFIFVKIGLQYGSALDLLAYRFTMAFFSIVIFWVSGVIKIPQINVKKIKQLVILSLFYPVFFFLFQTYGMESSSVTEAGIIFAMSPIVTLVSAQIFLKEQTSWLQKCGIGLSVLGILYIVLHKNNFAGNIQSIEGILLLFLSIFSFAGYIVAGKKSKIVLTPMEITVWMTVIAFVVFNIWNFCDHLYQHNLETFFQPMTHINFIWSTLYLGVLSTVVTSFFSNYSLPLIPASQIAVLGNLSPIFAIISGILLLDEHLFSYQIIGGFFVLIGIAITLFCQSKE